MPVSRRTAAGSGERLPVPLGELGLLRLRVLELGVDVPGALGTRGEHAEGPDAERDHEQWNAEHRRAPDKGRTCRQAEQDEHCECEGCQRTSVTPGVACL